MTRPIAACTKQLAAIVDDEDREQLRQPAEDRGEGVAGDVEPAPPRSLGERDEKAEHEPEGQRRQSEPDRQPGARGDLVAPAVGPEAEQAHQVRQRNLARCGSERAPTRPAPVAGQLLGMPSP